MRKLFTVIAILMTILSVQAIVPSNPKREFRGAWLHTVFQSQYSKQSTAENKKYLISQLDKLQKAGVNAVLFQVRPQADAFYPSKLEPWSRHLTGKSGVAPSPMWDPLAFMIEECHRRGMELHAWLNPYRVTTSAKEKLADSHLYNREPNRFLKYDNKLYFDPGLPENRTFIEDVVKDIITRYDVDAIHMDDYFYPYPVQGVEFPDSKSFAKYGNGMKRGDWRRKNVDLLIEGIHNVIEDTKPWVRLGISPFGIWRNKINDKRGSDTNGLQNYDDLYADVTLWTEKGWVDYMLPQLYWELEHKRASSEKLVYWWNNNANGRHMYIGQDVVKTMDKPDLAPSKELSQLNHKIALSRDLKNIQGNCWWPGYSITSNYKGVADSLANNQQSTIALVPSYQWISKTLPKEVNGLTSKKQNGVTQLSWKRENAKNEIQYQASFVVYCFPKDVNIDLSNSKYIIGVTRNTEYTLPKDIKGKATIVVTALDRVNNESKEGVRLRIDL